MKGTLICTVVAMVLSVSGLANGTVIDVDPDAFPENTNISNAFLGVTLSSVGPGFDGDHDPAIFALDPLAYSVPYNASTGSLVFGTNDTEYPHVFGGWGDARFRADFDIPTKKVWLDAIGNNNSDFAMLEAFDVYGNLLDTYTTGKLQTSIFETMLVLSGGPDIAYVVASGVSGDSVGFDHLVIPEPATICLLGLGGLGLLRRRKSA